MRQGKLFHQRMDIICFCHIWFQEFTSRRCIIKKISHKKRRSFRRSELFQRNFLPTFNHITGTADIWRSFCDQFYLWNSCNTGKCLTTEPQRCNVLQIFDLLNFTCRMTQKCKRNLLRFHSGSIICDADQLFSAICDLHSHSRCSGIYGILYQFFYNRRRTLHYLPCSNLVNCVLI